MEPIKLEDFLEERDIDSVSIYRLGWSEVSNEYTQSGSDISIGVLSARRHMIEGELYWLEKDTFETYFVWKESDEVFLMECTSDVSTTDTHLRSLLDQGTPIAQAISFAQL